MNRAKKIISLLIAPLMLLAGCKMHNNKDKIPGGYVEEYFSGQMFEESFADGKYYNYCPSIMVEGDEAHIYYCGNKNSAAITDFIMYRHGMLIGGKWYWGEKKVVLSPTFYTWDERHVCDPDVIKGSISYNGENYGYLMAYLGCITSNNQDNEVGLAVAKTPDGPFIKVDELNPIAKWQRDDDANPTIFQWGYGQPSLVSVDKKGQVLLFYTKGEVSGTHTQIEQWDFTDLNNPIKAFSYELGESGLKNLNGLSGNIINNASFAYDNANKKLYFVGDGFPRDAENEPSFVSVGSIIGSIDMDIEQNLGELFADKRGYSWAKLGQIDHGKTGFFRNHNCGIITDPYGHLFNDGKIEIAYTMSELNYPNYSLWTYRIYKTSFDL